MARRVERPRRPWTLACGPSLREIGHRDRRQWRQCLRHRGWRRRRRGDRNQHVFRQLHGEGLGLREPAVNTAFHTGKTPVYFGIAELGGAYSTSGSGSETETSPVHMTVDLTKAGTLHDLIIGFYSGTAAG